MFNIFLFRKMTFSMILGDEKSFSKIGYGQFMENRFLEKGLLFIQFSKISIYGHHKKFSQE